ncbi:MAG: EVE domain-containing protein [Planctomycetota bacterium]|jgi:predicted RNA-binding protein with PUA-like domain
MAKIPDNCNYWLFKSEPSVYSFDDLLNEEVQRTHWDGVRNYAARNLLRDKIKKGDGVFFYHSSTKPLAIVGIAEVVREGYPDPTAFDPNEKYYDPKSDPENPTWYMVDIRAVVKLAKPVTRDMMLLEKRLKKMMVLQRGARMSVQPVTTREWDTVLELVWLWTKR